MSETTAVRTRDKYLLIEDGASLDHLLQKYSLDEILSLLDEIFNTRTSGALWASNQVEVIY